MVFFVYHSRFGDILMPAKKNSASVTKSDAKKAKAEAPKVNAKVNAKNPKKGSK